MYTQQEAAALRQKFWISFGKYISPIPSASGEKVNWINYRTGIEITHKDVAQQELYFNHFKTFKKALEEALGEKWTWQHDHVNESGNHLARIYASLENANVYNENDWPKIISFLKERIILLDKFWCEYRDIFDMLD